MSTSVPSLPTDALPAASFLDGDLYQVDSLLGRGGFGLTYLCAEPALLRWVAVKELFPPGATRDGTRVLPPPGVSADQWSKARRAFEAEARRLATFADPCVVRVYKVWEENNTAYMAMEALDGGSLAARLKATGTMTPARVAELGIALCRALTLLHGANLLHRDLKPDNIFFAPDNSPILIDFGNARGLVAQQTQTVSLALTPGYAPPESYSSRGGATAASDIYSLGATLWECLGGQAPPDATDRTLGAPLQSLGESLSNCPPQLIAVLENALQLKPEARFKSAADFSAGLERALKAARAFAVVPAVTQVASVPATAAPVTAIPATTDTTTAPTSLPWSTSPGNTNCPSCGRPVKILDTICPHCGRFKNGYVPGEHANRRAEIDRSWVVGKWVFGLSFVIVILLVSGMRFSRTVGRASGSFDANSDTSTKFREASTELRRTLQGSAYAVSVRPQFHSSSVDIVATTAWQKLSPDDRMDAAQKWANAWLNVRAPLPAPFQITDANGNVLGGRTAGAGHPWLR